MYANTELAENIKIITEAIYGSVWQKSFIQHINIHFNHAGRGKRLSRMVK